MIPSMTYFEIICLGQWSSLAPQLAVPSLLNKDTTCNYMIGTNLSNSLKRLIIIYFFLTLNFHFINHSYKCEIYILEFTIFQTAPILVKLKNEVK